MWKVWERFPYRTVQSVVVYSSITFHINGKHDSFAPYPNTVTGVMPCVSAAWYFCVATRRLKYLCYKHGTVAILHSNCVRIEWFQKFCQNHIIYLIIAWSNPHSLMKTGQFQRVTILYKSIDKPRPWMDIYGFIGNRCKINNIVTRSKSSSHGFIFFLALCSCTIIIWLLYLQ